jgi:hypothetical protein
MTRKQLAWVLCAMVLLCSCTFAQTISATLQGSVVDPGDAAVPGATLELKNVATGAVRTTTTTAEGVFRFNSVVPAIYNLNIKASAGFKASTVNDINISASEVHELGKIKLTMGAVTEEVSVTAAATPVQTTSSENSKLVDSTQVSNLALKGRDVFAILALIPGVNPGNAYLSQGSGETASNSAMGNVSINGGISGTTNFTVDGITAMDPGQNGGPDYAPNIDAIAEVRVLTTNYQAEYGRNSAGVISIVTKGGGQEFHGGASANKRHEMFNAKSFFTNLGSSNGGVKPQYRFFVWNYNVGGPVYIPHLFNTQKKRLFFFWSQEYTRQKPGPRNGYANVPNANQLKGDFSYYTDGNYRFTANTLRNPVSGAYITPWGGTGTYNGSQNFAQFSSSFDAQSEKWGQAMLAFMPKPNLCNAASGTSDGNPWNGILSGTAGSNLISPTNCPSFITSQPSSLSTGNIDAQGGPGTGNNNTRNYYWSFQGTHPRRNDSGRVDINLTSKLTSWVRYTHDYDNDGTAATLPEKDSTGAFTPEQIWHPNPGHGFGVGITYTVSPTMVNEFTFGKSYNTWSYYPNDESQLNRANMLNPPTFDDFATDPKFVADTNLPRAGMSPGHQNFANYVPGSVSFGGSLWGETTINPSNCGGYCPYTNYSDIYSFSDNLSKVIGKHNVKAGLYVERTGKVQYNQTGTYLGQYNFGGGNALMQQDSLDGYVNAYLGNMQNYQEGQRAIGNYWLSEYEAFIQDNWRVSKRLTLDLGARFYHMPPAQNLNDNSAEFIRSTYNAAAAERVLWPYCTVATTIASCPANTQAAKYQYAWDKVGNPTGAIGTGQGGAGNMYPGNLIGTLVPYQYNGLAAGGYTAGAATDPFTGMQVNTAGNPNVPYSQFTTQWLAWTPRIGLAWDVFGDGKTAIRTGFGIFLNRGMFNQIMGSQSGGANAGASPVNVNRQIFFAPVSAITTSPLAYKNGTPAANNLVAGLSPYGMTNLEGAQHIESTYNGSLGFQQNLGYSTILEASWVFTLRRHGGYNSNQLGLSNLGNQPTNTLYNEYNTAWASPLTAYMDQPTNTPGCSVCSGLPGNGSGRNLSSDYFRPIQGYGNIIYNDASGTSDYHALQAQIRRNFTRRLSYQLSYTWNKVMAGADRNGVIGFTDKFRSWGPSFQPTPHVIAINYVYQTPPIAAKLGFRPLSWVTDDWQISGITQWRSNIMTGYPGVSVTSGSNSTNLNTPNWTGTTNEGANNIALGSPELVSHEVSYTTLGGSPTAASLQGNINGTPGDAIFNLSSVMRPFPCSAAPAANMRLGIGQNFECFGNTGPGSLFPIPHTHLDNWDMTFTKRFPIKGEHRSLEFRAEMYNIFNHTQFTGANLSQSYDWKTWRDTGVLVPQTGSAGRYNGTVEPRLMSMNIRFTF